MVDGVNFNPFTGKIFTNEEIDKLDANKDGTISSEELQANISWLSSNSVDEEGTIDFADDKQKTQGLKENDPLMQAAQKAGMSASANDIEDLKRNILILSDEYTESYMTNHPELSSDERKSAQNSISINSNEFINKYIAENPTGPYDMSVVAAEFKSYMDSAEISTSEALGTQNSSSATPEDYINNTEENYEKMLDISKTADENDYVTNNEWSQVKEAAISYLLGTMLSGSTDTEMFSGIRENYENSSYYQLAKGAIEKIQNETDPAKIQELLETAKQNIEKFLDSAGKDNVVDSINDIQNQKEEDRITQNLQSTVDKWLEENIKPDMSDDEKQMLKDFASAMVSKYIETMSEQNALDGMSESRMAVMFNTYLNNQYRELRNVQQDIDVEENEIQKSYDELVKVSDAGKASGYVSEDEKGEIVDAASKLIMNQMLMGLDDIILLESLDENYKNSSDYQILKGLVDKIKASVDADELESLMQQAEEKLSEILNSYTGDELADAVDGTKPVQVSDETKTNAIYNSSISSDYYADVTRTSDKVKQKNGKDAGAFEAIVEMARTDLQAYAESMKAELKEQLGDRYDESEIQKYIDDAINDTIKMFSDNKTTQKNAKRNNYDVASDQYAFVFCKNNRLTKKGRYAYSVQALINAFTSKFNEISSTKQSAKLDTFMANYDRENVIADSVGQDYYYNKPVEFSLTKNDMPFTRNEFKENEIEELKSQAIEEAKKKLQSIGESLKDSLRAEGADFDESEIDKIINQSIQNIISDPDSFLSVSLPKQRAAWGLVGGVAAGFLLGGVAGGIATTAAGIAAGLTSATASTVTTAASGTALGGGLGFGLKSTYSFSFNTKDLTDRFFDEFDQLYDKTKKEQNQ